MATDNEPAKLLLPYLQRADELQTHEPLVAYYCRLYAMERGLRIPQSDRTKIIDALLFSLMNQLEKDKKSLKLGTDDNLHVEGFALSVFEKADKQDIAGRTNLNTAKTFYAASIFFEILNQFGELHPDLEQKQKYAAWKAADIRKALKEGRNPVPGPSAGDKDQSVPSRSTSTGDYEVNSIGLDLNRTDSCARNVRGSDLSAQPYNQDNLQHFTNIPPQSPNVTSSPSSSISPSGDYSSESFNQPQLINNSNHSVYPNLQSYPSSTSGLPSAQYDSSGKQKYEYDSSSYEPPAEKIAEAHKAARFAVGALAFDDVSVAVGYLKKSLHLLTNLST